ncbi:hypothetical protein [Dyella agri]|uniref:Uncharacterized protein n=1 Tax=Dyella agri TaxID=1926869 RepID=A0ABW8KKG0_9GAMM
MPSIPLPAPSAPSRAPLETFVACAHEMLDPATPEALRLTLEPRLVALLPVLRALGVFRLFELRDPALRAWVNDELAALVAQRRLHRQNVLKANTA